MNSKTPYIWLIVATCIWGGNFVAGKAIVAELPPISVAFCRWGIALLILLVWRGKEAWKERQLLRTHWKTVAFLSITGVAGFNTLTYISVQYTSSINASLMNAATPIFVVFISRFILQERIRWLASIGIGISIIGVLWIISHGSWSVISGLSFNVGDMWMLLAILCWAFYSVGMKKAAGRFVPSVLLIYQVIFATILLFPVSMIELAIRKPAVHFTLGLTSGLLYVGIFASIVAFTAWNRAIATLGPARCSGFLNMIPLFSAIFATFFAGERIHLYHAIGTAFIICGVYTTNQILKMANTLQAPIR
jgi:drug/metabolite transporter (DMT)-like permease